MNTIYSVITKKSCHLKLWRVNDTTFRVIELDNFSLIIEGSDYTLIDESLFPAFETLLSNELEYRKVKILRKATQQEWNNYYELIIKEYIDSDKIKITNSNSGNIWQYNHHIFVSDFLKNELEKIAGDKLSFSVGFSFWG